jgi:16S rRNA (guanine527-N7)-methyltransferase
MITTERIQEILTDCQICCTQELAQQVEAYLALLEKWNRKVNLTGRLSSDELVRLHFAESFRGASLLEGARGPLLDVGTGAGFPGLAIKLVRPELEVLLLEARRKKAAFLAEVRRQLGLERVWIVNRRLEECDESDFPRRPALLSLRAVGDLVPTIRRASVWLERPARLLLFTTRSAEAEIRRGLPDLLWDATTSLPWSREKILLQGMIPEEKP